MSETVKERPILFSGEMVRAILRGEKTVTRRIIKVQPPAPVEDEHYYPSINMWRVKVEGDEHRGIPCPYGRTRDRLWVRETWAEFWCGMGRNVSYRADECPVYDHDGETLKLEWKPSSYMFRADSRILLEIAEVQPQRLHDMTEEDAKKEGITTVWPLNPDCGHFVKLWNSINGKTDPWESNPWVWAVSFRVLSINGKEATP